MLILKGFIPEISNLENMDVSTKKPKTKRPKKSLRLVSYNDDTVISDDAASDQESNEIDVSEEEVASNVKEIEIKPVNKYSSYGFNLPPEPKGKCPVELQEKINSFYEKMKNSNMDMNRLIEERKDFRNPSIYEKLIQFCDIDELGTNYPPEIYDSKQWGKESYYEELARGQKVEMEKREKDRKDHMKNEAAAAATKKIEEDAKKRKSKWDQPGPSVTSSSQKSSVVSIQSSLTTTATGTKGTVISAFGNLPKKPKP